MNLKTEAGTSNLPKAAACCGRAVRTLLSYLVLSTSLKLIGCTFAALDKHWAGLTLSQREFF